MAASPNDTVVAGIGATIIDNDENVWTIDANGRISVNGEVDPTTANVDALAYDNGLVWQKNADNHWYSKSSPGAEWQQWPAATAPVIIPDESANDTTILAGGTATLVDPNGNVWSPAKTNGTLGYQVVVDGVTDPTTANVVQMAVVDGTIWQQNTAALWYSKTTPASAWTSGTSIDPLTGSPEPVALTWVGGGDNKATNPSDWSPAVVPRAGDTLSMGSGTMKLSGNALAGDTLHISPHSSVNIDTSGSTNLTLSTSGPAANINIDIAAGSTLNLTAGIGSSFLNVSGGTLSFIGTSVFGAFRTTLNDNVTGTGTVDLFGGNAAGETMEINGSVGKKLTFDISAPGPHDAGLQIDHPSAFHGSVVLQSGWVGFMGLHATSGELLDGILEMFNGSKLVDAVRLAVDPNGAGQVLQMQQNSSGVMLSLGIGDYYQPGGIGTPLPVRT